MILLTVRHLTFVITYFLSFYTFRLFICIVFIFLSLITFVLFICFVSLNALSLYVSSFYTFCRYNVLSRYTVPFVVIRSVVTSFVAESKKLQNSRWKSQRNGWSIFLTNIVAFRFSIVHKISKFAKTTFLYVLCCIHVDNWLKIFINFGRLKIF